jgi:hypothetical protein
MGAHTQRLLHLVWRRAPPGRVLPQTWLVEAGGTATTGTPVILPY